MKIYKKTIGKIHIAKVSNDTHTLQGTYSTVCQTVTLDSGVSQLTAQIDQAKAALGSDAKAALGDVISIMEVLAKMIVNPFQLSDTALAQILAGISDLVVNILKAVDK